MKAITKMTTDAHPSSWLDWLAPLALAFALYCFVPLNYAAYGALHYGITPGPQSLLAGAAGAAAFIAIFLFVPAVTARARHHAFLFLSGGIAVSFLAPYVLPTMDGIFTSGPIGDILNLYELPLLPLQIVNALTYALIAAAWFTLRGFPGSSYAWLALILPAIMLLDTLIEIWMMSPVPFPNTMATVPDLVFSTTVATICFGFGIFPAILTRNQFRRSRPRLGQFGTAAASPQNLSTLALMSFVFAFLIGIVGAMLGHLALNKIHRTREDGHRLAIAGVVIGYTNTLLVFVLIAFIFSMFAIYA